MVVDLRRLTVKEYYRMGKLGILDPNESIELIDGQIIKKPMKGTSHEAAITRIGRKLGNSLVNKALIRYQSPIHLNEYSEPEPDIAIIKIDALDYEEHHPHPNEIYLLIEVADSSIERDIDFKAKVYAKGEISDYWVLDLSNRQLYVFRQPFQGEYQQKFILSDENELSILAFEEITIQVREMLRPQ
ncbi:MAG: Uma2 family endonuclease [Crocosphaera sp.]